MARALFGCGGKGWGSNREAPLWVVEEAGEDWQLQDIKEN